MGSFLTEIEVTAGVPVPAIGEEVLNPRGGGTLMMNLAIHLGEVVEVLELAEAVGTLTTLVIQIGEVVEAIDLETAGRKGQEAVRMIG